MTAALAVAGCTDDTPDLIELNESNACKAVKDKADVDELEKRFGDPDGSQDFFGDRILTYEDDEMKWQFQVTEQAGTLRAIRVEGKRETVVDCR